MATYKLDATQNPDKVFVVKRSELENRIDPNPYSKERIEVLNLLNSTNTLLKLKNVVRTNKTVTSNINESDVYVGLENIVSDTGEYIKTSDKESVSSANVFKKGQILFPKLRPYLNKVYLAEFDGICSTEFHIFETKNDDFSNEFIAIYLRLKFIVNQTKHLMTGNTLPRLQTNDIENLPIPKISKETQQQIVEIYNQACTEKLAKEAQAQSLLASIDSYLLSELGITLPEQDHSLAARIFTTQFSEVVGGRMDPKLYDNKTKGLFNALKTIDVEKFKLIKLKDLLSQSVAGDWGIEDEGNEISGYTKCLVIRATEFDNDYNLKLDNSRTKYRLIKNTKLESIDVKENDLLIEKSGGSPDQPVGRIAILEKQFLEEHTLAYSNFIHKITLNEEQAVPQYVFCFLKTVHNIKLTEAMQSQTNGIRNLIMRTYLNQNIIIPITKDGNVDLQKQNEIATHIQGIRRQAKTLQQEAVQVLEQVKQQVEQMILG